MLAINQTSHVGLGVFVCLLVCISIMVLQLYPCICIQHFSAFHEFTWPGNAFESLQVLLVFIHNLLPAYVQPLPIFFMRYIIFEKGKQG